MERIYIVESLQQSDSRMLVQATNAPQALRLALQQCFNVRPANTIEVAEMVGSGSKVIKGEVNE